MDMLILEHILIKGISKHSVCYMCWEYGSLRKFDQTLKTTPYNVGPGKYDTSQSTFGKLEKGHSIQSNHHMNEAEICSPDPGFYDPKVIETKIPVRSVFSSHSKRGSQKMDSTPDPTKYSSIKNWAFEQEKHPKSILLEKKAKKQNHCSHEIEGYAISESGGLIPIKKKYKTNDMIGPGTYNDHIKDHSYGISLDKSATRDFYGSIPDGPGPGKYTPFQNSTKIYHQIVSRIEEKRITEEPFQVLSLSTWTKEVRLPSPTFQSRSKRSIFTDTNTGPSPCDYEVMSVNSLRSSDSAFGSRSDRNTAPSVTENPGPGYYESKPISWIKKPKKLSTSIPYSENSSNTPGPGFYYVSKNKHSERPSSVFASRSNRNRLSGSQIVPGPGTYDCSVNTKKTPILINRSDRFKSG